MSAVDIIPVDTGLHQSDNPHRQSNFKKRFLLSLTIPKEQVKNMQTPKKQRDSIIYIRSTKTITMTNLHLQESCQYLIDNKINHLRKLSIVEHKSLYNLEINLPYESNSKWTIYQEGL